MARLTDAQIYVLGLLAEEAGEVTQVVGKALRFGIDTPAYSNRQQRDLGTARERLQTELGDVLAAIDFAVLHGLIGREVVELCRRHKLAKLTDPGAVDNLGRRLAPQPAGRAAQEGS